VSFRPGKASLSSLPPSNNIIFGADKKDLINTGLKHKYGTADHEGSSVQAKGLVPKPAQFGVEVLLVPAYICVRDLPDDYEES
jgi:hypothetical protein